MDKKEKHIKAEEFRKQISMPAQRTEAVMTLASKEAFDESDKLRIGILLHKVAYAMGCEAAYTKLICRLYEDPELQPKARDFYKRWTCK